MGFLSRLFGGKPEDILLKGEREMSDGNFYEARCCFEDGLSRCRNKMEYANLIEQFEQNIIKANNSLSRLNLDVAGHAISERNIDKAREHLELAKTLTLEPEVREKADLLLASINEKVNNTKELATPTGCSSCSSCSPHGEAGKVESALDDTELDPRIHYELLIHQLPEEMFERYLALGEDFAYIYIAASRDEHSYALELLEAWHKSDADDDIYLNEKGKILHRLGQIEQSEECFRAAIACNTNNHLPYLGLSLLMLEGNRFDDAGLLLDEMIAGNIFRGQSIMMRGEVFQLTGDLDRAIEVYASLLPTPLAKSAAEKLYEILQLQNRHAEAAALHKQYLKSCSH